MKNVLVERSSKERIESVKIGDLKFRLHDEFEYADGGIIVGIEDNSEIRKYYEDEGFPLEGAFFKTDNDEEVSIDNVACKLDIREGDGGYTYYFDNEGNDLYDD
jgi:hypothetical protein